MLSSISWQHYLAAILLLTACYYGYIILRYYQVEISKLFNHKQDSSNLFNNALTVPFQVMGLAKQDPGVSLSGPEDLIFTDASPDELNPGITNGDASDSTQELSQSPGEELIKEMGNLIDAFQEIDDKPEFMKLLQILFNAHKPFEVELEWPAIMQGIVKRAEGQLMFTLTLSDLHQITV